MRVIDQHQCLILCTVRIGEEIVKLDGACGDGNGLRETAFVKRGREIVSEMKEQVLMTEHKQDTAAENENKENWQQDGKDASGTTRLFFRYSCSSHRISFLSEKYGSGQDQGICERCPVCQTRSGNSLR